MGIRGRHLQKMLTASAQAEFLRANVPFLWSRQSKTGLRDMKEESNPGCWVLSNTPSVFRGKVGVGGEPGRKESLSGN